MFAISVLNESVKKACPEFSIFEYVFWFSGQTGKSKPILFELIAIFHWPETEWHLF